MKGVVYSIQSWWHDDLVPPTVVGKRFVGALDRLSELGPEMDNWWTLKRADLDVITLADARLKIAEIAEDNVTTDDFGEPSPEEGYWLFAHGSRDYSEFGSSQAVELTATTGARWNNELEFQIGSLLSPPDLSLVTYATYRGALEILASQWPCPWLFVDGIQHLDREIPHGVPMHPDLLPPFQNVWIAYLSPSLAAGVSPSSELTFERTPAGELIMSAVEDRFDPANAEHLRRSRILQFIMTEQVGPAIDSGKSPTSLSARRGPY